MTECDLQYGSTSINIKSSYVIVNSHLREASAVS